MRLMLLLVASSLLARPCLAQANLEVPVCQWGDCSKFCDPACGAGFVCNVEGKCVAQKTDEQRESDAVDRRHKARMLTRVSLGVGVGQVQVEGILQAHLFALELGVRQQLAPYLGVSTHLGVAYAPIDGPGNPFANPTTSASSYSDCWADFIPYLGPLGRFYVGPALVLAYRHYAAEVVYSGYTPPKRITNRLRVETGGRLGLLLGNREQFDLWLQETTSVSDTTLNQTLLGFAVEFL